MLWLSGYHTDSWFASLADLRSDHSRCTGASWQGLLLPLLLGYMEAFDCIAIELEWCVNCDQHFVDRLVKQHSGDLE